MRTQLLLGLLIFLTAFLSPSPPPARAAATLELYTTFHSMGLIVTLDAGDDPDEDAIASVEYRTGGGLAQTTSVGLLVGGARVYLPITLWDHP